MEEQDVEKRKLQRQIKSAEGNISELNQQIKNSENLLQEKNSHFRKEKKEVLHCFFFVNINILSSEE